MINKFYKSLVSLKYVYFMFGIPLIIFTLAFLENTNRLSGSPKIKVLMIICAILLGIVLIFYYRDKITISRILRKVDNITEYESGGMIDRSYILEDRMLVCEKTHVQEISSAGIKELHAEEGTLGHYRLKLVTEDQEVYMSTLDRDEAQRFAAFLKRKNPDILLADIEPKGSGTLKELGA